MSTATAYIAGPMRGHQFFNFPAFDKAKAKLEALGYNVISPADLDREVGFDATKLPLDSDWNDATKHGFDVQAAIDRDIEAIKRSEVIYVLRGWQQSKGARAEKALAEWVGLYLMFEEGADEEPDVLEEALSLTKGDRQASYGPPDQDFQRTAQMWSAMKGVQFDAREVAMFMIALKLSRETHQRKRDNWVDIAGYARCGSLCRPKPAVEPEPKKAKPCWYRVC